VASLAAESARNLRSRAEAAHGAACDSACGGAATTDISAVTKLVYFIELSMLAQFET
jgi:hypothetical protein